MVELGRKKGRFDYYGKSSECVSLPQYCVLECVSECVSLPQCCVLECVSLPQYCVLVCV